jgi:hypothetical protein
MVTKKRVSSKRRYTKRRYTRRYTKRRKTRKSTRRIRRTNQFIRRTNQFKRTSRRDCGWPAYLAPGISRNRSCTLNYDDDKLSKLNGYSWAETNAASRRGTIPSYVKPYMYKKPIPFQR